MNSVSFQQQKLVNSWFSATGRPFGESWGQRTENDVKGTQHFPLLQGTSQLTLEIAQQSEKVY